MGRCPFNTGRQGEGTSTQLSTLALFASDDVCCVLLPYLNKIILAYWVYTIDLLGSCIILIDDLVECIICRRTRLVCLLFVDVHDYLSPLKLFF